MQSSDGYRQRGDRHGKRVDSTQQAHTTRGTVGAAVSGIELFRKRYLEERVEARDESVDDGKHNGENHHEQREVPELLLFSSAVEHRVLLKRLEIPVHIDPLLLRVPVARVLCHP